MRILGIDPGVERVGFGLIEMDAHHRYHAKDWGVITTPKTQSHVERIWSIHQSLTELIAALKPTLASVEELFFFRNVSTVMPVSEARGVILLALHQAGLEFAEYTPMQVKMHLTGYGKATKQEVQHMVKQLLNMDELPRPDDAADALAIAMTCAFEAGQLKLEVYQ